ncbi:MAG: hypothetical protein P8Y49_06725 [Sulfurovaceae bacterium]
MDEMTNRYAMMVEDYQRLYAELQSKPVSVLFTCKEFFSLQPYYYEISNEINDDVRFYKSIDELPCDNVFHQCFSVNGRAILVRSHYDEEVYYDSLFEHGKNISWRYEVYVNGSEITPMTLERLERTSRGATKRFQSIGIRGYIDCTYTHRLGKTYIRQMQYDINGIPHNTLRYKVDYDESTSEVLKISEIIKRREVIRYDASLKQKDLSELLLIAIDRLSQNLLEGLEVKKFNDEICFILFEYTMQGPFPPTVAFATRQELEQTDTDSQNPLRAYNAPDLSLFYDNTRLDDVSEDIDSGLWGQINIKLEEINSSKSTKLVMKTYIELCRQLMQNKILRSLITTADHFHVVARDFEACNEWEMMQKILPTNLKKWMEKRINAFEALPKFNAIEQAYIDKAKLKLDELIGMNATLRTMIDFDKGKWCYSEQMLANMEPFKNEASGLEPLTVINLDAYTELDAKSLKEEYYAYFIDNERELRYAGRFYGGEQRSEIFFIHVEGGIESYTYNMDGSVESYSIIRFVNNVPSYYAHFNPSEFKEGNYLIDKDNVVNGSVHELMFSTDVCIRRTIHYKAKYDSSKLLHRLEHTITLDDQELDKNNALYTIDYSKNDDYIMDGINESVALQSEDILKTLNCTITENVVAVVLQREDDLLFPIFNVYLIRIIDSSFEWEEFSVFPKEERTEKIHLINIGYFMYNQKLKEIAFEKLRKMLKSRIKQTYNLDVQIYAKNVYESLHEIIQCLKAIYV